MFFLFLFCLHVLSTRPPWASTVLALGVILSLRKTPEMLCGLENVTGASIEIMESTKLVKNVIFSELFL